jgi:tripartite-type tricarboxylate transporter receptor subunit TctC
MTIKRRVLLQSTAVIAGGLLIPALALAQAPAFPRKPLRIVVPNAPGGAADITARTIAQAIGGPLGQAVVIENKPGAGGVSAGESVAKAEPDGHTLLLVSSGTAVSEALFKQLPFDTVKDFAPVAQLATFNLALYVADNSPFKTLADVLAYARANPGKLNVGTPQVGTTQNLAAELFRAAAGIDFQVVPFNGTPPVINALRGGQLDVGVDILGPLMGQINGKAIRAIALMGDRREPLLPDVPTVREAGGTLASFNATSWNGLAVPAKTPPAVIARLNSVINTALQQPEVKNKLAELTLNAQGSTPEQLGQRLAADVRKWTEVIERAKIPKQ